MSFFELLQKVAKGELPKSPAANLIKFKVAEAEDAKVIIELKLAGIIGDIADTAIDYAFATTLKIGKLCAESELLKKGHSIGC